MSESGFNSLSDATFQAARVRMDPNAHLPRVGGDPASAFRDIFGAKHAKASGVDQARQAAEEFVAQALVKPVLAQLRSTNQATGPFAPGPYEKQLGPLVDNMVAERIVKSQRFPIVEAVEKQLRRDGMGALSKVRA